VVHLRRQSRLDTLDAFTVSAVTMFGTLCAIANAVPRTTGMRQIVETGLVSKEAQIHEALRGQTVRSVSQLFSHR
jgi:hypothetical protein